MLLNHPSDGPAAIRTQFGAIFVSLELSRSTWLITSLSPGKGEKMSKHSVTAGDVAGLMKLFAELRRKAQAGTGESYPIITVQEAGLDGFWLHRVLQQDGIESHVVDPASIATSRRRRRAKTDRLDGEALLRALLAYKRGEPRVCAMVVAPSPEEEDRRRLCRERATLIAERITHVNRIKGLLFAQGISDYVPLRRNRRARLEALRTGDGRELPSHLKAQIGRELDRIELLLEQIKAVEAARDALLAAARKPADKAAPDPVAMLLALKGLGRQLRGRALVGGVLPAVLQPPPARRLWGPCGDALAKRRHSARAGRVEGRQSQAADHDDPARLALDTSPAAIGPDALVQGAKPARPQARDRGAGTQAARGPVEVRHPGRRHRGGRDEARRLIPDRTEGRVPDRTEGACPGPHRAACFARAQRNNHNPSAEARSASEDPGGRTDGLHGFKRRNEEWPRPLEPARRKRNLGAVASRDDRM
ncbi:transposase [Bradyrhizobium sp. LB7.2]